VGEILAKSPPKELDEPIPNIPLLKANPRKMPARVAALLRILVFYTPASTLPWNL
jgi:hypothetical protein